MIIAFHSENSDVLKGFLDNLQNPKDVFSQTYNSTFVELRVKRFKDVVLISARNFFDVWAKFMLFIGFAGLCSLWILGLFKVAVIPIIIIFFGAMWLSREFRFILIKAQLRRLGHRFKMTFIRDEEIAQLLFDKVR